MRFFCLTDAYRKSKFRNFRPERTKAYEVRAEWNFYDFSISQEPMDEIEPSFFYIKGMDKEIPPDATGAEWKFLKPYFGIQIK